MSGLFHWHPKDPAKRSGEIERETSDGGRSSKLNSAGSSEMTLLVNDTDKELVLRDKIGAAYGDTRYKIPRRSDRKVTKLEHTFFKMIAYAIEEEDEEEEEVVGEHSSNEAHHQGSHKKKIKKGIDTKLTIDSDRLADSEKIVISFDGSKYKVQFFPRP